MSDEFKPALRNAFADATALLVGALAGGILGYLLLGDHWMGKWVLPVLGAGLVYHSVCHFRRAGAENS